ncbi:hypothetical protein P0L94_10420 [Microbacter sp. GSS18]|nr:hypothetical protein P0L94_10420 [Microbacter sp. GSS18]
MSTERFVVVALPHSSAAGAEWHVTAFITPKIDTADPQAVLSQFPLFLDWAHRIDEQGEFTIWDQDGPMDTVRIDSGVDAGVWSAAFPPHTPVRANTVPDWSNRNKVTYNAGMTAMVAKALHLQTAFLSPDSPPAPSEHLLGPAFRRLGESGALAVPGRVRESTGGVDAPMSIREFSEGRLRELLDDPGAGVERLRGFMTTPGTTPDAGAAVPWAVAALTTMHTAARFFEPASPPDTRGEPPDKRTTPPPRLAEVAGEFHKRVAAAGDHPGLLRALRLSVRLKGDPARLARARTLAVELSIGGDLTLGSFPRSMVAHPGRGTMVVATRQGDDTSVDGAVTLGESPYLVMDVDPDGSALKDYNYLLGFVRTIASEQNGDDVTAATPAMRAPGLIVTRAGRSDAAHAALTGQKALEGQLTSPVRANDSAVAPLFADQVTKGLRIEVWDDAVKKWASLHSRISTVKVDGFPTAVADEVPNEGYLQGTAASERPPRGPDGEPEAQPAPDADIHIHETVFGWEGWSLSAPRPGKTIVDASVPDPNTPTGFRQTETAVDDPAALDPRTPPHPFRVTHRAAAGTLPRLRYGRAYSFRAWAVDLAGEVRTHTLNPQPLPPVAIEAAVNRPAVTRPLARRRAVNSLLAAEGVADLQRAVRLAARSRLRVSRRAGSGAVPVEDLPDDIREAVVAAIGAGALTVRSGVGVLRRPRLSEAAWEALSQSTAPMDLTGVRVDVRDQIDLLASHAVAVGAASVGAAVRPGALAQALRTVTSPFPFLRWHPVPPPAIVAYARFTEGESLRTIVVRSGVGVDQVTGEPVVLEGEAFFVDVESRHPGFVAAHGLRDAGRRHVAPPRIAQGDVELHGLFDKALTAPGVDRDTAREQVLAWSLREDGSFFSKTVVDLSAPLSAGLDQLDIALVADPGADPATLRTLDEVQPGPPPAQGNAPGPGQYVVHTNEKLRLPYLPDPVAAGLSLTFVDAGFTIPIPFPHRSEGLTVQYPGDWPEKQPLFVRLESGPASADLVDHTLTITLPPGERVKVVFSSSLDPAYLDHLAMWSMVSTSALATLDLKDEVVDGRLWSLTPGEGVVFVNATPRPVERPVLIDDPFVDRFLGSSLATLHATFTAHGASTEHLTIEAAWVDDVDDLADPTGPGLAPGRAVVLTEPLVSWEKIVPFGIEPHDFEVAELGRIRSHSGEHAMPDTKHRLVTYRLRAQTRYAEYFAPELFQVPMIPSAVPGDPATPATLPDTGIAPDGSDAAIDDGQSLVGRPFTVHVPNTSVPALPLVVSTLPLLRWFREGEPDQPAARRHIRRGGIRIYLERPWFDTGSGELLAVLLNPAGETAAQDAPEWHSQWGADPIWDGTPVARRSISVAQLDHSLRWQGDDDRPARPGRPIGDPMPLNLPAPPKPSATLGPNPASPVRRVLAAGYRPQFNADRGLWYVDVAFDADAIFWPFVRLAVARFQPHSVTGAHLSQPVQLDFAQLVPNRTCSVSRTDERTIRVAVGGDVLLRGLAGRRAEDGGPDRTDAERFAADRRLIVKLQFRADPDDGDLAWETKVERELPLRDLDLTHGRFVCEGELSADGDIALRTPQDEDDKASWRVLVEEWESFPADPASGRPDSPRRLTIEQRIVFADEFFL